MTRKILLVVSILVAAACEDTGLGGEDMASPSDLAGASADGPKGDMAGAAAQCDLVKQDCPGGQKCTVKIGQMAIQKVCVASTGQVTEGMQCMRGMGGAGDDSCGNGMFCTGRGLPPSVLACRK